MNILEKALIGLGSIGSVGGGGFIIANCYSSEEVKTHKEHEGFEERRKAAEKELLKIEKEKDELVQKHQRDWEAERKKEDEEIKTRQKQADRESEEAKKTCPSKSNYELRAFSENGAWVIRCVDKDSVGGHKLVGTQSR